MLGNTYTMIHLQYYSYFPYIINFMSPSYTILYIPIDINKKKTISKEQLIGIVCGTTSVFFLILCIIINIIRKKRYLTNYLDYDISDESDDIKSEPHNDLPQKEQNNDSDNSTRDLDFWI